MEQFCNAQHIPEELIWDTATEVLPGGMAAVSIQDYRLFRVSTGLADLLGYAGPEEVLEASDAWLHGLVLSQDWECVLSTLERSIPLSGKARMECRLRGRDGQSVWVTLCAGLVRRVDIGVYLECFFLDLTDLRRVEAELTERCRILTEKTRRECMTGLLTKEAFREDVKSWLAEAGPSASYALLVIDLDDFKRINDRFGHNFGDRVLLAFSAMVTDCFGPGALCGRYGGADFVFCPRAPPAETVPAALKEFYRRLRCRRRGDLPFQCSTGAACGRGSVNFGLLFDRADTALYEAKRKGKNRYVAVSM